MFVNKGEDQFYKKFQLIKAATLTLGDEHTVELQVFGRYEALGNGLSWV